MNKQIRDNFSFAFLAQGISLLVSVVTNLILPKILGTEDFSYWQLFIFYATYIPCLAFGINDGVYLRYGGEARESLNVKAAKSQYVFGFIYQTVISISIGIISVACITDSRRKVVVLLVLLYFIIYTCHNFLGYIFQAINETNQYSKSIIFNRTFYLSVQIILLVIGHADVFVLIPFYIIAMGLALFYLVVRIRPLFRSIPIDVKYGCSEAWISIKTGISLMISNLCAMLVTGVGRQIVDMRWGILAFGKVSFSLTLINFALTFIQQISMVLFPALRRLKNEELKSFYKKISIVLFMLLPAIYVVYLPAQYVLKLWLPNYSQSIKYLAIILPICFFDSKMNLIGNTFFKVLNKQVALLKVNIITIALSGLWGLISAFVFNNMTFVVVGMVVAIMFRSVFADLVLGKLIGVNNIKYEVLDIILGILFIGFANFVDIWISFIVFTLVCSLRIVLMKSHIQIRDKKISIKV